uniref:Uncharacterized protein n=1 Tax=Marseillevirus sp. TaxID=2809551 RepID=A0AA96IXX4_9VIRU|nr:hypothetical protein MarFTMF_075 [Marseillevirus sp.]
MKRLLEFFFEEGRFDRQYSARKRLPVCCINKPK